MKKRALALPILAELQIPPSEEFQIPPAKESDVMLNKVLALSNAEVKHLNNTIKGDPSLRSG